MRASRHTQASQKLDAVSVAMRLLRFRNRKLKKVEIVAPAAHFNAPDRYARPFS
jgi:hypothetical protein